MKTAKKQAESYYEEKTRTKASNPFNLIIDSVEYAAFIII
ncbi:hypothetical protein SAMN05444372_111111 [Flavobacterium micromati]|uniref:Uncharacterized protein n=1 Tax=Flavobacterium micromati TaxID=229205 RepID=A0A1M5NKN8_9FLAO|nr:hypothetical protein SAMN05444372_111111 [Flavobacterium micromati]